MRFLYICPFTNFSRDFSMHFLYICPSGNFHRDFQAYLFSICPQNTRKRARKRECSTHGNIPSFIYVFIFPVLSVFYSPCRPLFHCLRLFVPVYPHFLFSYSNVRLKRCSRSCPYFRLSSKLSISRTATSSALRNRL